MDQRATRNTWPPVAAVGLKDLAAWVCQRRIRVRVNGHSMEPTLSHAQYVWVKPTTDVHEGDIVLSRHPIQSNLNIIKRVKEVHPDGLTLIGDNPSQSTDSRSFGRVPRVHVVGVVKAVL